MPMRESNSLLNYSIKCEIFRGEEDATRQKVLELARTFSSHTAQRHTAGINLINSVFAINSLYQFFL